MIDEESSTEYKLMTFQLIFRFPTFYVYHQLLKDGNGEISQEEMEDVFLKMCKIVEKTEVGEIANNI